MIYVALLRGINVGGNRVIRMENLRKSFERVDLCNVKTYIQSGNVIFETNEKIEEIPDMLQIQLRKDHTYDAPIVILSLEQLTNILKHIPGTWNNRTDIRCYIAFIAGPYAPPDIRREVKLRDGIDFVKEGEGVLYMTTLLSGITKSGFSKLSSTKIYKYITIRNYQTTRKILELMNT